MEIIAAAFAAGLVITFIEGRDRARMFPDQKCRHCDQYVTVRKGKWVHDDGRVWAPYPGVDYAIPGLPAPLHPAIPSTTLS